MPQEFRRLGLLSGAGCRLLVADGWLLVAGCCSRLLLVVVGCWWLWLVVGCWLFVSTRRGLFFYRNLVILGGLGPLLEGVSGFLVGLGALASRLEPVLGGLGASWCDLEGLRAALGRLLGRSWALVGSLLGGLGGVVRHT